MKLSPRFVTFLARSFAVVGSACWVGATAPRANAQILYTSFQQSGTQTVGQFRQINGDGSGDAPVNLPFTDIAAPVWSSDAVQFALTSVDPARPSQVSRNVFSVTPATGSIVKVTAFVDSFDPQTNMYTYVFPFYKAFSPDRSSVAVYSIYRSGGGGASESGTPILQIFSADGNATSQALVHADPILDGTYHGGEGVDWSSTQNMLAAPFKWDPPFLSGNGRGEGTAIFLAAPITDAAGQGQYRQLTFPRADQGSNFSTGLVYIWGEHDYQPKFSPNSTGVAYVRSFQQLTNASSPPAPDPYVESLHIVNVSTGADTTVLNFAAGQYVSAVTWSPDGTAPVFDLGPQATSNGSPLSYANPATDAVYVVNVDGTGFRQLLGAGTGLPAWTPAASGGGGTPPPPGTGGGGGTPPPPGTGTVSVAADSSTISRQAGQTASVTVSRAAGDDSSQPLKVFYNVGGRLVGGTDYRALSGAKTIKAGRTSAIIRIVPLAGGANGKVKLTFQPASNYTITGTAKVKVAITD